MIMHTPMSRGRIVIIDRHPIFAASLASWLREQSPLKAMTIEVADALASVQDLRFTSLLLVDLATKDLQGADGLLKISANYPDIALIAVCDDLPEQPRQLLAAGAMAGISKAEPREQFLTAIVAVLQGGCWLPRGEQETPYCELASADDLPASLSRLSPRRQLIVERIAEGRLNKQIAYELGLCESTVKAHVSEIMKQLQLRNRTQIAAVVNRLEQRGRAPSAFSAPCAGTHQSSHNRRAETHRPDTR